MTVRVADGEPGEELQADFGAVGWIEEAGRRRRVWALVLTAVVSRHHYVWLSYRQSVGDVIAGCEAAWAPFLAACLGCWCRTTAGQRVHGTTQKQPLEHFERDELPRLLPKPEEPYEVALWVEARVQRDHHLLSAAAPTRQTTRLGSASTPAATRQACSPRLRARGLRWAPTPSGCFLAHRPGLACATSTACSAWCVATAQRLSSRCVCAHSRSK